MSIVNDVVGYLAKSREMAEKAKLSLDQLSQAAEVFHEEQEKLNASRRASSDDKAAIDAYLASLNGHVSPDMPVGDILAGSGVGRKQGTSNYARRAFNQLLLTHSK